MLADVTDEVGVTESDPRESSGKPVPVPSRLRDEDDTLVNDGVEESSVVEAGAYENTEVEDSPTKVVSDEDAVEVPRDNNGGKLKAAEGLEDVDVVTAAGAEDGEADDENNGGKLRPKRGEVVVVVGEVVVVGAVDVVVVELEVGLLPS